MPSPVPGSYQGSRNGKIGGEETTAEGRIPERLWGEASLSLSKPVASPDLSGQGLSLLDPHCPTWGPLSN